MIVLKAISKPAVYIALLLFACACTTALGQIGGPLPYASGDPDWMSADYATGYDPALVVAAPQHGCDSRSREMFLGECLDCELTSAESGITYDFDVTQFYFGVADGGLNQTDAYSGHGDYLLNFDGGKLGIQDGLFIKLRAEHRFGETINADTGSFFDATVLPALPVFDGEEVYLTNVLFTQMLSDSFAVFAGKFDTLDGDPNAFAHGRGKTQFSNLAFITNPALVVTIPYSTLGAGFIVMRDGVPVFSYTVMNPTDTTQTSGFEELFAEGVAMAAEMRLPVSIAGLPGHQLFGGTWSSRELVKLDQDPRVVYPDVPLATANGSWALYYNFDQYLYLESGDRPAGWGVFGRAAIADQKTNPVEWFLSAGIGGNGLFAGREQDGYGVGWYYAGTSSDIGPAIESAFGPIGDGQGVECFYNYEVTPWFHLTPDLQVIVPAREDADTALVLGLRGQLIL